VSKELRLKSDKLCHALVSFTTYFKLLLHAITIGGWKLLANATSIPSNRKLASSGGCHRKSWESLLHVSKADILELKVFVNAVLGALTAQTRLLHTSKRRNLS
jgi:hypothetical protein